MNIWAVTIFLARVVASRAEETVKPLSTGHPCLKSTSVKKNIEIDLKTASANELAGVSKKLYMEVGKKYRSFHQRTYLRGLWAGIHRHTSSFEDRPKPF